ncbi:Vgr family protein [Chryseobacterium lactis]|uniref:Vgr family protein n=1 Tax=Chryseobacterium lactis TaxID=1241981 RepID=A0A3G6RIC9_CHRLC|nr:phage baseplate assembly protein V [Chryseobacterium lactis]AZA82588.1 Vgr family protein [Chryseobacterium lactis]AZB02969.1 Vgr family protein [Chryseobacterium lactis]PNW10957.1 Vgr family protein [Chryseobacterium lactis]
MFQDDKTIKVDGSENETKTGKELKNNTAKKAEGKLSKAGEKVKKVAKTGQQSLSAAQGGDMFMNQTFVPNNPSIVENKVWAKQPTSKIHNAEAIPDSFIAGINRVVKLDVIIEGKIIKHFKHFRLTQSAAKHHEFSLTLAHDTLGNAENHNLQEAQGFLGKRITIVFKYKDIEKGAERNFVGVITEVGFSQEKGSLGNIVLKGYSPTVLLDAAPHIQSFGGSQPVSLNSIADLVIRQGLGQNKFDFRIDAQHGNVSYSSQYEETHYNYLARMAEAYGEQFYYDGEVLHFGKLPPQEKPVKLTYGSSVSDIAIKMKAQHVNPTFYGYNSSKNEKLTTGSSKISHASDIARRAYEISEKTFTTPSLRVAPIKATSFMDIDASQKGTAGSKASEVFITSGTTTVPFLYPGCTADIEMRKSSSNETSYFTKLMIIEVTHEVDARGYYDGRFEAIAADTGFIPRPEFETPRAEAQFAKVTSNTDPLNQGRVQVQFDWQNGPDISEFIRVMSPDAGSSDKVNKNRGFMSVPEVGDQVIVNFVHQHPDRPFVMGGMFHGAIGSGGGTGNNVMSFSGRSGAELKYDNGAGSMNLKDQGGANMFFDGSGNAETNANNNKLVNVGNDNTKNVNNNNTTNVGCKHTTDVGKGQSILTMGSDGVIDLNGAAKVTLKVGTSSIEITKDTITVKADTVKIEGKSLTNIGRENGTPGMVIDDNVTIKGGQVDIN